MSTLEDQNHIIDEINNAFIQILSQNENIKIILMYGSRAKGTASPKSDAEYIVITETEDPFNIEFLYNNIPVDLWSTSWDWIEKLANRTDQSVVAPSSFILGRVIFTRSANDRERYEKLISEMKMTKKYTDEYLNSTIEHFHSIKSNLGSLLIARKHKDIEYVREHSWWILIGTTIIFGKLNRYLYSNNWGANFKELFKLDYIPNNLENHFETLVRSNDYDKIVETAVELVDELRKILIEVHSGRKLDIVEESKKEIADTHSLSYINKIRISAKKEDIFGVGYAVHDFIRNLKLDLIKLETEFDKTIDIKLPCERKQIYEERDFPNFHHSITEQDFESLINKSDKLERRILEKFPNNRIFDTYDEMVQNIKKFQQEVET